jgi:hypothetical protein
LGARGEEAAGQVDAGDGAVGVAAEVAALAGQAALGDDVLVFGGQESDRGRAPTGQCARAFLMGLSRGDRGDGDEGDAEVADLGEEAVEL